MNCNSNLEYPSAKLRYHPHKNTKTLLYTCHLHPPASQPSAVPHPSQIQSMPSKKRHNKNLNLECVPLQYTPPQSQYPHSPANILAASSSPPPPSQNTPTSPEQNPSNKKNVPPPATPTTWKMTPQRPFHGSCPQGQNGNAVGRRI